MIMIDSDNRPNNTGLKIPVVRHEHEQKWVLFNVYDW